jgi:hypothetical protein
MVGEMMDFCHQLTGGEAVNIVSCVPCPHMTEELLEFFEIKSDHCPILPPTDVELGAVEAPLSWRKCVHLPHSTDPSDVLHSQTLCHHRYMHTRSFIPILLVIRFLDVATCGLYNVILPTRV